MMAGPGREHARPELTGQIRSARYSPLPPYRAPSPASGRRNAVGRSSTHGILLPLAGEGAGRRKGGATNPTPDQSLTDLSPRFLNVRDSKLSRAPKRDHDEWLVRWMVGWSGSRSGPGLKYLGMGQFAGQAAAKRTGRPMQGAPGGKAAMHKAAGKGGQCRVARVARPPMLSAMRHGMLPSPGTISPKPRSAGEARAS